VIVSSDEDRLFFDGETCTDHGQVWFEFGGYFSLITPGDFLGTHNLGGTIWLLIFDDRPGVLPDESGYVMYVYYPSLGTMSVTQAGAVGGFFEGTFDITFEARTYPAAPSFGSPLPITGDFRLLRVSDTYWPDWAY